MTTGMFICGDSGAPDDAIRVLAGLSSCCYGAATSGPLACTCWETEYDLEQQPIRRELATEASTREKMCEDCAYRANSPESQGDDRYNERPSGRDDVFWCHQGMRKPVRFKHPLGIVVEASGDFYQPPIIDRGDHVAVPFKADGTPGDRCAGWAAQRRLDGQLLTEALEDVTS